MAPAELIAALSDPRAYPHPPDRVEVRHTHISAVFLAGGMVYKIKKPVALGFLDFSTPEKRRHFCEEEVRLNRRLAPAVYHDVVPVVRRGDGLAVEAAGEPVEWAVKMARLPDDATLLQRLRRGELTADHLAELARRVAAFHAAAGSGNPFPGPSPLRGGETSQERVLNSLPLPASGRGPGGGVSTIAAFGRFAVVAGNARENFAQAAGLVGTTVSRAVFDRLRELTDAALERLRPLIEARADRGVPRDTHGDLHLDHVYHFPDRPPPDDWVVIDCIEFNERFRYADPVADAAFLVMDLKYRGRPDLAAAFADAYFAAAGDAEGRELLPFYVAYRAAVRGKVEGMKSAEAEVPAGERAAALAAARAHWLLALGELEEPGRRPVLLLVGGLPGTGKSTLARAVADRAGFEVVRSDVVRKELAGLPPTERAGADVYSPEWTERTYSECVRRAEALLFDGRRVIVDATFSAETHRRQFLDLAARLAVPAALVVCRVDPATVRARLAARTGDASDADWAVYEAVARRWEEPGAEAWVVATDGPEDAAAAVLERLARSGPGERGA